MEDQFAVNKTAGSGPNIRELFYKYVRFLPFFVLSVAVMLLGAYLYLRYSAPVYQAAGALLVKGTSSEEGSGAGGDRFSQLFVLDNSINIQSEIELLKSKPLMEQVVEKLGINYQYHTKGKISEVHHYKDVPFMLQTIALNDSAHAFSFEVNFNPDGSFAVEGQKGYFRFGQAFTLPQGRFVLVRIPGAGLGEAYRIDWKPTGTMAASLLASLQVAPKGSTGILNLVLETSHPLLAADVLNGLMREYQVATIEDKNETKRQTIAFVDDRLQVVSRELDSVTALLLAYQRANNLIDAEGQSAAYLARIDAFDVQTREQEAQVSIARMIETYLADSRNNFSVVPSSLGLADPTLNTMISAYNVAQLERKALVDGNVPPTNARVQQMNSGIEQLRLAILESIRNLKTAYNNAIGRLQQEQGNVRSRVEQLPIQEQNLLEIKRQQEMKQAVFKILMEKREESAISLAATISNIKVVEAATPNPLPVRPNRNSIRLIAIALGLAIPALVIFILELLNDKVTGRADIEKITDVPILGEIGHSYANEALVVRSSHRGIVAEQFRIVRSNLQYVLAAVQRPVILVTSSFSSEGKSFVSTNLGAVLSLAGKRTLILEFDIRKPKVLAGLGLGKKPGLTNWLLGKAELEDLPVPVPGFENLFVLPCGPVPPNPAEMLLLPKMETLFAWVRSHYDVVVMDTAPAGIVSDALTLSHFADATLYITRQGRTFKKQVELIDDFARQEKLPRMSVVLNDVRLETAYGYYSYGKYGYGYGEQASYFEEAPNGNGQAKKSLLRRWRKKI
jgi:capsular exopolysaccharide synthesis family protein